MKYCRVLRDDAPGYGIVRGAAVELISGDPFCPGEVLGEVPLASAELLAPVIPSKVVCVGLNYRAHAAEMRHPLPAEPVLFLKPPTACVGPGAPILLPPASRRVEHEAELAVVMGQRARALTPEQAAAAVLGLTCANDVTARDLQARDGQWTRAKSFDTFCPFGPWVVTGLDPRDLLVEAFVNGTRRQSARTSDLVCGAFELVSFVSRVMTLLPGDLILTGTPAGVGPLSPGDTVEVRVEGVGSLVNPVA